MSPSSPLNFSAQKYFKSVAIFPHPPTSTAVGFHLQLGVFHFLSGAFSLPEGKTPVTLWALLVLVVRGGTASVLWQEMCATA